MELSASKVMPNQEMILRELCPTVAPDIMEEIVNSCNLNISCCGNTSPYASQEVRSPGSSEPYQSLLDQWVPEESIMSQDTCQLYTSECYTKSVYNHMVPSTVMSSPDHMYWPQYQLTLPSLSPPAIESDNSKVLEDSNLQLPYSEYSYKNYAPSSVGSPPHSPPSLMESDSSEYCCYNYVPSSVGSHVPGNVIATPSMDRPTTFWSKFTVSPMDQYKENISHPTTAMGCGDGKSRAGKSLLQCSISKTLSSSTVCTYVITQDNLVTNLNDSGIGSDISTPPSASNPHKVQSCTSTVISPPPVFSLPLTPGHSKLNTKASKPSKRKANSDTCKSEAKKPRHNEPLNDNAVNVMQHWYESHRENPYPSKQEKEMMSREGNISLAQVKSWFANKRNRSNNTRPKVQKRKMQEKLLNICQQLSTDSKRKPEMNSQIIHQLSCLINQAQQKIC